MVGWMYLNEDRNPTLWGYSAINRLFRKSCRAFRAPRHTPLDVGSGKGAAVLMASEFPYKRLVGVELNAELVHDARDNVEKFNTRTGKHIAPEWSVGDFFQWKPPQQPCVFFFNNPFPATLTLLALERLEKMLSEHQYPTILVFRKAPKLR